VRFEKRGWRRGEIILAGLPAKKTFSISSDTASIRLGSDARGNLTIGFDPFEGDGEFTEVTVTRDHGVDMNSPP
jgi:hypothetical protein